MISDVNKCANGFEKTSLQYLELQLSVRHLNKVLGNQ